MLPLYIFLAVLALLTLAGILVSYLRSRELEKRLAAMDRELRQFYRDLGRPKAEIINIKERKRPS